MVRLFFVGVGVWVGVVWVFVGGVWVLSDVWVGVRVFRGWGVFRGALKAMVLDSGDVSISVTINLVWIYHRFTSTTNYKKMLFPTSLSPARVVFFFLTSCKWRLVGK